MAAAMLAAACGPLPKPFKPPPTAVDNPLVRDAATSGVWVEPLEGTSAPMSMLLSEAVAAGFKLYGIAATTHRKRSARYRLKGEAEINEHDPTLPYVVLIHWTLFDTDDNPIGAGTQGVPGSRRDWDFGSPKIIREVGETAPEIIAALIDKEEEGLKPVGPKLKGLWVTPVDGAPGDGGRSLTRAIKAVIGGAGITVAAERRFAEFVLRGGVRVDRARDGLQRVEIVWTVLTQDGREVGRATQRNLVEAGTFDGAWGEAAAVVAAAAVEGIEGVLRAAGASRFGLSPGRRVLKTALPGSRDGIVLPPPTLDVEVPGVDAEKP